MKDQQTSLADAAARPGSGAEGPQDAPEQGSACVSVVLPYPFASGYSYLRPDDLSLAPGDFVLVPLGGREVPGVVWALEESSEVAAEKLKPVLARFDAPPLSESHRQFLEWLARYTVTPLGSVVKLTLGSGQALVPPTARKALRLAPESPGEDALRLTAARRKVLEVAADGLARSARDLASEAGVGPTVVKGLLEAGALEQVALPPERLPEPDPEAPGPTLSPQQQAAAETLKAEVREGGFQVTLLDGVTGSGKTEVYFEAVAEALRAGRQVLVLLPEIALSAQWIDRFQQRFGVEPALWHSDVPTVRRRRVWRAVAEGDAKLVVGARSALFLPFQDLGLVVVDEEQEGAYKQEDGVVYHARDMAVVRARCADCPIVLVSATPSIESLVNAEAGKYGHLALPERHGGASLPSVELIDLKAQPPKPVGAIRPAWLSDPLRQALTETLAQGEQALLFLNRRGYAPLTLCRGCGHRIACPNCSAWLVEHRLAGYLQCHHCGHRVGAPRACPACGAEDSLTAVGPGVERLAEEVKALLPEARLEVLSSDLLLGPLALEEAVRRIESHAVDVIIGTQLVAKGHHFPLLTCVGVVDADLGLQGGDPRAFERTYQMLHQVAGRAGRASAAGRVFLQTHVPEHPVMQALAAGDREGFVSLEIDTRREGGLPPFARLAAVIVASRDEERLEAACRHLARSRPEAEGLTVLGPAPAPFALLRGWRRSRFLLRARRDVPLQSHIRAWLSGLPAKAGVRVQVDIDPYSFL